MAMLAEPRRKQKWNLNPRGKQWSEDSSKFGQKMLEKMGWSSGKGLGANMDGMTEHIRLKYKNDQGGVGFSRDDQDKQWTQHQEGFNELLQKLHGGESAETTAAEKPADENDLSGKSLELKSKQSRARVHYQKFTRGKDVNKYSTKDLANIFGKKDLKDKPKESEKATEAKQPPEEAVPEPVGSSDSSYGVVTIKGGSISDYFKSKMSALGRKVSAEPPNDSESDSEPRAGFGFSSSKKPSETPFSFTNPALDLTSPPESKNTPRKRKNEFAFENPALELASPLETVETPRKRKSDFAFTNPVALNPEIVASEPQHTPKRRKSEISFDNSAHELATPSTPQNTAAIPSSEDSAKKKRKKKLTECSPAVADGFVNEALNLESRDDETSTSSNFEVPRARFGLANNALDLTDETSGKKRVTFNESVEYDTDLASGKRKKKKKKKNGGKLDKFEIDNEKMKRRMKRERQIEIVDSAFVNEAMDVEPISQEADENAANERKSERAKRKRDRRMSNLETIAEAPDEERESRDVEVVTLDESFVGETSENLQILSLDTPKRRKKKSSDENSEKTEGNERSIDASDDGVELIEEILSLDVENSGKKSRASEEPRGDEGSSAKKGKKKKKSLEASQEDQMEVSEVQDESAEGSRREKSKKKKKNANEESKENVDTENVAAAPENCEESESARKKKKKRKKEKKDDEAEVKEEPEVKIVNDEKKTVEVDAGVAQSPWNSTVRKSKRSFKALFARAPVVNFVGSNINEIKGYGVDLK